MMQIAGMIATVHRNADCVAAALAPDNLNSMTTTASGDRVTTIITGTQVRSVIASVDDYLTMLAIADDACSFGPHQRQEKSA
jgi:predicted regulator of Ras-like GTPase activity (Roadblock/LC7/MglB family)